MKIKKLELIGFKSFVDRTVIHFDHDVLGIVGPNGCGKSNIVDAIRWCMGEQSAKHLRGKSMEDVLFNGSETRAAVEIAEVTLTFENDDPTDVPLEYKDYTDIAVTRRLHRSGESEYLINKTPVRLKDVTDLFLGTGVGTKAYSIVEQGRIGLIVSAKAEDRRMLIEEAAGITKYKSRKRQAERKMELTQQNLLRVGDIVAEIERNLGSLKRQAAKAERFLAYRAELEDLQLTEAAHRYLELVGWTKLHAGEVASLGEQAEQARAALAAREAELEAARQETLTSEEALEKAQNESFTAENDARAEEAAIERAKDRLEALRAREDQAAGEVREIEEQRAALAAERDGWAEQVATYSADEGERAARAEQEAARLEELAAELASRDAQSGELRQSVSRAQAEIASALATLAGFDHRKDDLSVRIERARMQTEDQVGAAKEHEARARTLAGQLDDLRAGKVTSAEERQLLEVSLATFKEEILHSERALEEARADLARTRSRLVAIEEIHARREGVGAGAKALVAKGQGNVVGLVADRVEAPAELTQALAGLLGHALEDVVVDDVSAGVALLAELAKGEQGRATIVPRRPRYIAGASQGPIDVPGVLGRLADRLRYAPEDETLVRVLVGDALLAEDDASALAAREAGAGAVVTLAGTVFHPDGRVSGGAGDAVAAHMLELHREARELSEATSALSKTVEERLAAHQALRASIVETQAKLDGARQLDHQRELALVTCEKDLHAAQTALEATARRLEDLAKQQAELAEQLAKAEEERAAAERSLEASREALVGAQEALSVAEAAQKEASAAVDAQRAVLTETKVHLAGAREKLEGARGTVARLDRSVDELAARRARLEAEMAEAARAFGETAATLMAHKATLHDALDRAAKAQEVLALARGAYEQLRAALGEREALLKDLRAEAERARDALGKSEMALREKELELEHLLSGVAEKFRGLALHRVIGDYHLRTPIGEEGRSRIAELANLIDRMGSVNLEATREYQEAEQRFTFYSTQKADLEKALLDLQKAIAQMNKESRRLFAETFEAVNAKFQELFPKMFRGGRASLRLTNPEDMLETGIDILAQPPGKKLSNIELMSGGEKALTAVSLIFAIFQIKPSPFCILDEVDAPLDEANVARYNEAIRDMTHSSQFILITHIKRTMQMVDVLYGVTMQEPGVSRIVSVKMHDNVARGALHKADDAGGDDAKVQVA